MAKWTEIVERYITEGRTVSGGCGASKAQEQLQQSQMDFYNQLTSEYTTIFGQQQEITNALTKAFMPILQAGPSQQGFSPQELQALESTASTGMGQSYAQAQKALAAQQGAEGGGNAYLPTGAKQQQQAALASSAAQQLGGEELGIEQANYAQGLQNFQMASNALMGNASLLSPTGLANAATGAGSAASTTANEITQANQSWMGMVTGVAGAAASAFCPAIGSRYLMFDGSEIPVQELAVGDQLMGIDDTPQTIEEIQSAIAPIIQVTTANGRVTRNSLTHAFALPRGGFIVSAKSLGSTILTNDGPSPVIAVKRLPEEIVFNIITNGCHTYCADGVWALGVGDAERHIGMDEWAAIGRRMFKSKI